MKGETARRQTSQLWLLLVFGAVVLGLIIWSSMRFLSETPVREASADLPGYGWVTVRLTIEPFPPQAEGTTNLHFIPLNNRGLMIDLGSPLAFNFGRQGEGIPIGTGEATLEPGGTVYRASVRFPGPGNYWLALDLGNGHEVRYRIRVTSPSM